MAEPNWLSVPVGIDATRWMTRAVRRCVLVVAHTMVSVQRLADVVEVIESDPRIQVVFTRGPDVFGQDVEEWLRTAGALTIPWRQAIRERFDLALAAAYGGLSALHAPIMVLPHGAGYAKRTPSVTSADGAVRPSTYGLGSEHLIAEGRVVPSSIVLSHEAERDLLEQSCPAALNRALVAGDPCYDRLVVDLRQRTAYRAALGVGPAHKLVVVSSTWGANSLFRRYPNLPAEILAQLDRRSYRVTALIHPGVWSGHGRRQIRAWLAEERRNGLRLIEPEVNWRPIVAAADCVVGDHGSVPTYASAIGIPVLRTLPRANDISRCSAQWLVARHTPRLDQANPLAPQLTRAVRELRADLAPAVAARLTSAPNEAHQRIRAEIYRLLKLAVPDRRLVIAPDPVPDPKGA